MISPRLLTVLPVVALAACVPAAPEPTPPPAPAPAPPPPPPPPPPVAAPVYEDWTLAPQTAGDWHYAAIPPYTYAAFGPSATQPIASIRCDRANGVVSIGRTSGQTVSQPMTIRTETAERAFATEPRQGSVEQLLVTDLPARDSFLDAIAFSRGRFALEVTGELPLYLPAWPEISRVIDDCR